MCHDLRPGEVGSSPLARGLLHEMNHSIIIDGIIPARAGFTRDLGPASVFTADHPRSRGVYRRPHPHPLRHKGSSPLARGLPDHPGQSLIVLRIIPARAGFTKEVRETLEKLGDHPRSRGVYGFCYNTIRKYHGSSPLARGLLRISSNAVILPRIIPARAGFTPSTPPPHHAAADHPRSRGVYLAAA